MEDSGYPARHGQTWTAKEMWKLCELYPQPVTWFWIAQEMERTISACQARWNMIRIACLLYSDKSGEEIIKKMAKQGRVKHKKE